MSHEHHHRHVSGKNILITIFLNFGISVLQLIGGLVSGSTALLSDAAHNFSDVLSLILSYWAIRLSGRQQTLKQTYGFRRAGILAAFINTAVLIIIALILIWEAVTRLLNPQPVEGLIVVVLAFAGVLLNGVSILFIRKDAEKNINIKAASLHLFADMLTSVAVMAGGLAIIFLEWIWLDSVLTILIACYLIWSGWGIFYESIRIFMQFTPSNINIEVIAGEIMQLKGVKNIHHVHVWQLDENELMLEAHIDLKEDYRISQFEELLNEIESVLDKFGIHHFNIQPELFRDDQKDLIINRKE